MEEGGSGGLGHNFLIVFNKKCKGKWKREDSEAPSVFPWDSLSDSLRDPLRTPLKGSCKRSLRTPYGIT